MRNRVRIGLPAVVPVVLALTAFGGVSNASGPGSAPPQPSTVSVRHGGTITLDRGALRVRPTNAVAFVTRQQALFDARHSDTGDGRVLRVAYGAVTVDAATAADPGAPGRLPTFRSTPAWVVFVGIAATPCPAPPPGRTPPHVPKWASSALVLVVNARTGVAARYDGVGSDQCAPNPKPDIAKSSEMLSVRWFTDARGDLKARLPGCSGLLYETSYGSPKTGSVLEVVARHAFGPCSGHLHTVPDRLGIDDFPPPVRHAPVGPIASRNGSIQSRVGG